MKTCRTMAVSSLLVLSLLTGCSGNGGGQPADVPRPADADSATGDVGPLGDDVVQALTGASPHVAEAVLTEKHGGWGNPDCAACHQDVHAAGFGIAACVGCHGTNGAPFRKMRGQHASNEGCAGCHAGAHAAAGIAEGDCRVCHGFQAPEDGCGNTEKVDVVVIGAGGGGLSAAAALALGGLDVVVLEQSYKVGGCAATFERAGYRFEASLHGFDGLNPDVGMNVSLLKELGILDRVKPVHCDPMYQAVYPDFSYDIPADVEDYRDLLKQEFPAEAEGIDGLFDEMLDLNRILSAVLAAQAAGRTIPDDVTVDDLTKLQGYMTLTLTDVLGKFLTDPRLIALWTQLAGFAGGSPDDVAGLFFIAMWNSYHIGGYYYFEGGSQSVPNALAEVVREKGGRVLTSSRASRIVLDGDKVAQVQTEDGRCFDTRYVVSNANAPDTLLKMVGKEKLPADYVDKLESMTVGLSAFVVYLGVAKDYSDYFPGTHGIMINDGYDTVDFFEAVLDCAPERTAFAVSNYTVSDPGNAPAGKNAIVIVSQLGYDCGDEWKAGMSYEDYRAFKEDLARHYIERAEVFLPGLSKHIEVMEVATPRTVQAFTLNPRGSIFGWDNTVEQSMMGRLPQQTPVVNLFLAGAWTFPGGGQSAVLISGATAARTILALEKEAAGTE
ncbi:MAG: NAD(P)/FAD-dependent oxidoreductase [Deltaproteobacteria bacterium]|nr:NAD(P)/FAD-dependent oxidoreductase [Deltaproteobacteria bacterium]